MNLSTAKTLAGVGMILKLFGAVPVVGWIFSLVDIPGFPDSASNTRW